MREYKHRWHYLFTLVFRDKWLSNFSLNGNFEMKQKANTHTEREKERMGERQDEMSKE